MAAAPRYAGVASGILNTAPRSGGALSVALLGSGPSLNLRSRLAVAAGSYLVALAWTVFRNDG